MTSGRDSHAAFVSSHFSLWSLSYVSIVPNLEREAYSFEAVACAHLLTRTKVPTFSCVHAFLRRLLIVSAQLGAYSFEAVAYAYLLIRTKVPIFSCVHACLWRLLIVSWALAPCPAQFST